MKDAIHPKYVAARVTCVCGNSFITRSTVGNIRLEICSECHPFYTGKQKMIDTAGRIDRFNQRFQKSQAARASRRAETAEATETNSQA